MIFQPQIIGKPLPTLTNPGTAADLLSGKQLIDANGNVLTGMMPTQGAQTITPGIAAKTIAAGRYLTGAQTVQGDPDLVAGNIKSGVNIFGVSGNYSDFPPISLDNSDSCEYSVSSDGSTMYITSPVQSPRIIYIEPKPVQYLSNIEKAGPCVSFFSCKDNSGDWKIRCMNLFLSDLAGWGIDSATNSRQKVLVDGNEIEIKSGTARLFSGTTGYHVFVM